MPPTSSNQDDPIHTFLLHADRMVRDAQFIVDSLPNVETFAVERSLRQLHAIHLVLINMDDVFLEPSQITGLIEVVLGVSDPLQSFHDAPSPPRNAGTSTLDSISPHGGRPRYNIDLQEAVRLHALGNSWESVSEAMGVGRKTLHRHLQLAGLSTTRKPFTSISDDDLDEHISSISLAHPFAGSSIIMGHLETINIHLPSERIQESVRRVDALGVLVRWSTVIKRRVYKVRGSNALWHMDGNEKIRPWGFYVHGCIDGHSRLIIYLICSNNKRSQTVEDIWMARVAKYGWPSRGRGDYGKENNGVERRMIIRWGIAHRAFLRGRSLQNIRIERLWRDVRRDTLEIFRQIFFHLEELGLLDMESYIHRVCLYLVFQPRIQKSLDETVSSWNFHKVRTAGNKTPVAIYELSRQHAINRGYWTGDPGDSIGTASDPSYGHDPAVPMPPADEIASDPSAPAPAEEFLDKEAEKNAGVFVNEDEEIKEVRAILKDWILGADNGNWGIDMYCQAVIAVSTYLLPEV